MGHAGPMTATAEATPTVTLLDVDPDLGAEIPDEELALARRVTVSRALELPGGSWVPDEPELYGSRPFALLVVEGLITREVQLADRSAAQLLGAGQLVDPWHGREGMVPSTVQWTVNERAVLAVLDDRFLAAARRWPSLTRCLHARLARQWDDAAVHTAICQLPHVETRIVALLWHLAEHWGRVTGNGVLVPLSLTHEAIGRLVGAQRPTVSLALRALAEQDAVTRRDDGSWVLSAESRQVLSPEATPLPAPEIRARLMEADLDEPAPEGDREIDRLRRRLGAMREGFAERADEADRIIERAREATRRSAVLRERLAREREAAAARQRSVR